MLRVAVVCMVVAMGTAFGPTGSVPEAGALRDFGDSKSGRKSAAHPLPAKRSPAYKIYDGHTKLGLVMNEHRRFAGYLKHAKNKVVGLLVVQDKKIPLTVGMAIKLAEGDRLGSSRGGYSPKKMDGIGSFDPDKPLGKKGGIRIVWQPRSAREGLTPFLDIPCDVRPRGIPMVLNRLTGFVRSLLGFGTGRADTATLRQVLDTNKLNRGSSRRAGSSNAPHGMNVHELNKLNNLGMLR